MNGASAGFRNGASAPRVTVIMPCYNSAGTLAATLDSLLAQTFSDYEVIAVNDGSIDATQAILERYAPHLGGRLRIMTQENAGQTVAKTRALEAARGDLVALLDSDDLWHPDKLTRQVAFLDEHAAVGLCYTDGFYVDQEGRNTGAYGVSPQLRGRCALALILGNDIVGSSVMFRRALVSQVGTFDSTLRACENWDLWTRIADTCAIDYLAEPLTFYRRHSTNMSRDLEKMRRYRLEVVDKNARRFAGHGPAFVVQLERARYEAHAAFGRYFLTALDTSNARRDLAAAIRLRPRAGQNYILFLKSLLGARGIKLLRAIKLRLARSETAGRRENVATGQE